MKRINQIKMSYVVVMVVLVFLNSALSAKIVANYSPASFVAPNDGTIDGYVVAGAGYFLNSQSDYLSLLNRIELSDVESPDYSELQQIVDRALMNINQAVSQYDNLIQVAQTAEYQTNVTDSLTVFDYQGMAVSKQMNGCILDQVESYLKSGDVRGVYQKLYTDFQEIAALLTQIKSDVDSSVSPDLDSVWSLNQKYFKTMLFGQYTAEIFSQITGN